MAIDHLLLRLETITSYKYLFCLYSTCNPAF